MDARRGHRFHERLELPTHGTHRGAQADGRPVAFAAGVGRLRARPARRARVHGPRTTACCTRSTSTASSNGRSSRRSSSPTSRVLYKDESSAASSTASTATCGFRWSPTTTTSSSPARRSIYSSAWAAAATSITPRRQRSGATAAAVETRQHELAGARPDLVAADADPSEVSGSANATARARHRRRLRDRPGQRRAHDGHDRQLDLHRRLGDGAMSVAWQPRRRCHKDFNAAGARDGLLVPGGIRVIDIDGDGFVDRMYAGDMGGQVWRFDVTNGAAAHDLVAGGVIAQLGGAPRRYADAPRIRRFYNAPDVAFIDTRWRTSPTSASAPATAGTRSAWSTRTLLRAPRQGDGPHDAGAVRRADRSCTTTSSRHERQHDDRADRRRLARRPASAVGTARRSWPRRARSRTKCSSRRSSRARDRLLPAAARIQPAVQHERLQRRSSYEPRRVGRSGPAHDGRPVRRGRGRHLPASSSQGSSSRTRPRRRRHVRRRSDDATTTATDIADGIRTPTPMTTATA